MWRTNKGQGPIEANPQNNNRYFGYLYIKTNKKQKQPKTPKQ